MLGDYVSTILFFLVIIGIICVILKNVIPGILEGFLVVLKLLGSLAVLPLIVVFGIINLFYKKSPRIIEILVKRETHVNKIFHEDGSTSQHTYVKEIIVPKDTNKKLNNSGRF